MTLFTDADKLAGLDRVNHAETILNDYRDALGWPRQGAGEVGFAGPGPDPVAGPDRLTVLRLGDGGYLVYAEVGGQQVAAFAATTVDEALEYVGDRLEPVDPDMARPPL